MTASFVRLSIGMAAAAALVALESGCGKTPASSSLEVSQIEADGEEKPVDTDASASAPAPAEKGPTDPTAKAAEPSSGADAAKPLPDAKKARKKRVRRSGASDGPRTVTFDDIKFEMEKGGAFKRSMLTPAINELSGQKIAIRGYILPQSMFAPTGNTQFILVRDNQSCCFGPGAMLYDCIVVQMDPGKTASFTNDPIAVEGKFSVEERLDFDGRHEAIYRLDAESAR